MDRRYPYLCPSLDGYQDEEEEAEEDGTNSNKTLSCNPLQVN